MFRFVSVLYRLAKVAATLSDEDLKVLESVSVAATNAEIDRLTDIADDHESRMGTIEDVFPARW